MISCVSTGSTTTIADEQHHGTLSDFVHAHVAASRNETSADAFIHASIRTTDSNEPEQQVRLNSMSASELSVTTQTPIDKGQSLEISGTINHHVWQGQFNVIDCVPVSEGFNVLLQPTPSQGIPTAEEVPSLDLTDSLSHAETNLWRVSQAFSLAKDSWSQLGNTVQKLITKASEQFDSTVRPNLLRNERDNSRQPARLEADMVLVTSKGHRKLPMQILDVSEGGIGGQVPADVIGDVSAEIQNGEYVLHAGLPVMIAFGTEPDTLWMPAEIVHCDYQGADGIRFGVQFLTPSALQYFGA